MLPGPFSDETEMNSGHVRLNLKWTSGASGAVPAALTLYAGVTSVTHGATGVYTILLDDACVAFEGMDVTIIQAADSASGACTARVTADNTTDPDTRTLVIKTVTAAGAAVEPASGDVICLTLHLQHTAVGT